MFFLSTFFPPIYRTGMALGLPLGILRQPELWMLDDFGPFLVAPAWSKNHCFWPVNLWIAIFRQSIHGSDCVWKWGQKKDDLIFIHFPFSERELTLLNRLFLLISYSLTHFQFPPLISKAKKPVEIRGTKKSHWSRPGVISLRCHISFVLPRPERPGKTSWGHVFAF